MAIVVDGSYKPRDPLGIYRDRDGAKKPAYPALEGNPDNKFDTPLSEQEEKDFSWWKAQNAPDDSGEDYDLRGAFKAGLSRGEDGHWSDAYKKPNHPTFSTESRYAQYAPDWAGSWDPEGNYLPSEARQRADQEAQVAAQNQQTQAAFEKLNADDPDRYSVISSGEFEAWKAEWEKNNRSTGLLGDTIRLLDAGVAGVEQGLNELIGQIPGIGKPLQGLADAFDKFAYGSDSYADRLQAVIEKDIATLTPEMGEAREKAWWDAERNTFGSAWLDPKSYYAGLVESLPGTVLTMVPAAALARGAYLGALAKGATAKVAAAASAKTALVSGALLEGGLGGGQSAASVRQIIAQMPVEQLAQTEAVQSLVSQGKTVDEAIAQLSDDAATQAFVLGGVATGMFGGFGDRFLAKLIAEGVGGGLARRIIEGATRGIVAEGLLEEAPQEGLSQLGQNLALQNTVAPEQDLLEGVTNAAMGGAAVGATMGAGLGGVGGAVRPATEPQMPPGAETPPAAPPAPPTPPRGPLADAIDHGLRTAPADSMIDMPAEPVAASTRIIPDVQPVPVTPISPKDAPKAGADVVVEDEVLGRFTAKLGGYVETDEGTDALVFDATTGEELQVPISALRTAKLTDEQIEKMDAPAPIERDPPPAPTGTSRDVRGTRLEFPDQTHADLYDYGQERELARTSARVLGVSKVKKDGVSLTLNDVAPWARKALADKLQVPEDRLNELADDYRYRVDRATKGSARGGLPINIATVNEKLLTRMQRDRARAERDAALADPAIISEASTEVAKDIALIDTPANAAATSPTNDLPEPTQAQKEAGNYQLGHFKTGGLDLSIENPAGSERKGVDKGGKAWSVTMKSHYGYIKGTTGRDKDHIDVFVQQSTGELGDDAPVFVVDQIVDGKFDEHKVMLGFKTLGQARNAYNANYAKGWKGLGAITPTTLGDFKAWLASGNTSKEFAKAKEAYTDEPEPTPLQQAIADETAPPAGDELPADVVAFVEENGASEDLPAITEMIGRHKLAASQEKTSDPNDWSPEEKAAFANGDTRRFSELRGYTAEEIDNHEKYLSLARDLIEKYGTDFVAALTLDDATLEDTTTSDVAKLFRSKEWKAVFGSTTNVNSDTRHYAHPESPVAFERAQGWNDAKAGKPPQKKPAPFDPKSGADPINPYLEGYIGGRWGDAVVIRSSYALPTFEAILDGSFDVDAPPAAATPAPKEIAETVKSAAAPKPKKRAERIDPKSQAKPDTSAPAEPFAKNKLFTADRVEAARARLRSKMGQLNSGLDPEILIDGVTIAGAYVEAGIREFGEFAKSMTGDFGDAIKPYLLSFWEGVRHYPGLDTAGMTPPEESARLHAQLTAGENDAIVEQSASPTPEVENEPSELERSGSSALADTPAGEVRGAEGKREAGAGAGRGSRSDLRGSERARGQRDVSGRGLAGGADEVPAAAGRDDAGRLADLSNDTGSTPAPNRAEDYAISAADDLGAGGAKTKFRQNLAAIRLLRELEAGSKPATREQQGVLAKWVGWGGLSAAFAREDGSIAKGWEREAAELKELLTPEEFRAAEGSTRNAHYTSREVVNAIWSIAQRLGFAGGRVLEPSVGAGNFIGLMPGALRDASQVHGVELDPITGGIAKHLYPKANIQITGFQNLPVPDGYFDLAIGNPPFGSEHLFDAARPELNKFSIHNYFFAKAIDGLRPGGALVMVVTNYFLDANVSAARSYIADRADLIGAIRLPNDAFLKNAGTEVTTDIIVLQKRADGAAAGSSVWTSPGPQPEINGTPINRYFVDNPKMLLGEWGKFGKMYGRPESPALISRDGQDLAADLAGAIDTLPRDIVGAPGTEPEVVAEKPPADVGDALVNSMFLTADGAVMVRLADDIGQTRAQKVEFPNEKAAERVAGLIRVRDVFTRLRQAQVDPKSTDTQLTNLRTRLNKAYDSFVGRHGFIHADANRRLFRDDPTWPQLAALEDKWDRGISETVAAKTGEKARPASAVKAAIFTKRTQSPYQKPETASSAKDALAAVLADRGRVDLDEMARLYGKPVDAVIRELGSLIYKTPAGAYETADQYLSGNVKKKLAEARAAVARDPSMVGNIDALEGVIPADIEAVDIDVKPGAPWIPPAYIVDFMRLIADAETGGRAAYLPTAGKWTIEAPRSTPATEALYGTDRAPVKSVLEATINGKTIQIYDKAGDKTFINPDATDAANEKVAKVKAEWQRWLWEDDARREALVRLYNDTFNTDVLRQYDGAHLTFPGKVSDDIISFRPHQKNFIWRGLQTGTTLADHTVGTGKTFAHIALVMEKRRTGQAKKPVVVVPNHLVGQWAEDWLKLYPGANILAATKDDFEAGNRKKLFARIATGDWDAVIVAHSSFGKIPVDPKFEEAFIRQQMDDMEASIVALRLADGEKARSVKQVAKAREALQSKLTALAKGISKDVGMTFEELGIDALYVDEAHEFKNLAYSTSMQRVAGLGNTQGSLKAADLFMKVTSVLERTGGRNVGFATGTPLSNTMAEMFTMQRYLDYPSLRALGIAHFDAWAKVFGEVVSDWELSPSGKYKLNSRFAKFVNMPELMQRYLSFADVITNDDVARQLAARGERLPIPKIKGGKPTNIVVERSKDQALYIGEPTVNDRGEETYPRDSLVWRAENLPKKAEKGSDNMLKVMSDARKAALDMRLIDPSYADDPASKVQAAAANIKRLYRKWNADRGTQLVFIDLSTPKAAASKEQARIQELITRAEDGDETAQEALDRMSPDEFLALNSAFSVYDDLKAKLIKEGIPEREIAFIHDAGTDAQKQELFGKVRSGRIRVLFGSTAKMGAGTNVQNRIVALHHLDAPWRPSDLEQRDGRGIRQGNELYAADPEGFELEILRYATKNTLDARQWQTIEGKARFIAQVRKGDIKDRVIEDIAGEAANAAEMKAAASGNPLILEEIDLKQRIRKLEGAQSEHDREQHRLRGNIRRMKERSAQIDEELPRVEVDAARAQSSIDAKMAAVVSGTATEKPKEFGTAILAAGRAFLKAGTEEQAIGKLGEFKLTLAKGARDNTLSVIVEGEQQHETDIADVEEADPTGTAMRVFNMVRDLAYAPDVRRAQQEDIAKQIPSLEKLVGPWDKGDELAGLKTRHAEVLAQLRPKPKAPGAPTPAAAPPDAQLSAADDAPVAKLSGRELGAGSDIGSLRRAALRWYADNLVGEAVKTADGMTVLFNQTGAKETATGAGNATMLRAVPALRAIIERGKVVRRSGAGKPTSDNWNTVGARLAGVREARGMSQSQLATELNLSPQRYGQYERDQRSIPHDVLLRVWEVTGADANFILFGRTGSMPIDLMRLLRGPAADVRERIVIAAPVEIDGRVHRLAVTINRTEDGRFHYDIMPATPGYADLSAVDSSEGSAPAFDGWNLVEEDLLPESIPDELKDAMTEIVRKVAGLPNVEWRERIVAATHNGGWGKEGPIEATGYYQPGTDVIALTTTWGNRRVAYHEAFHRLQWLFLTKQERNLLQAEQGRLRAMLKGHRAPEVIARMDASEVEAEAFAIWANGANTVKPYKGIAAVWEKVKEVFTRAANYLAGLGWQVPEDIFAAALAGEIAARPPNARWARTASPAPMLSAREDAVPRSAAAAAKRVGEEATGKWTDVQPKLLAAVPLTYFSELAQKGMSAVPEYLRIKRNMDAYRGNKHAEMDVIAQEWLKYSRTGFGLLPSAEGKAAAEKLASLMHDATLAGVDPSSTEDEVTKHPAYPALRKRYDALSPKGRALFRTVRDAYSQQAAELDALILENVRKAQQIAVKKAEEAYEEEMDRIERSGLTGLALKQARDEANERFGKSKIRNTYANKARLTKLRQSFEASRVPAPYFPLARFGRYVVTVRDVDDSVVSFSRREKASDQNRLAAELRAAYPGMTVETGVLDTAGAGFRDTMDPRIVAEIEAILGQNSVDPSVMDAIWQRYLQSMPDLSTRKRFIHRKGVAGFDADALRAFASHMFHASHQMARLKHGVDLQEMLDQAAIQGRKAADPVKGTTLVNELAQRHKWVMNPTGSSTIQFVTSAMFVWYLAATPAAALVNLTQTPMLGIPIIGAKFGTAKTAQALLRASTAFVAGKGTVGNTKLTEDERWALGKFYETGLIDRTQSHELAGAGDSGVNFGPLRARVMGIISWGFHKAEVMNREVTALAAYRLAREAGESPQQALDTAHDLTWKVHFDYSNSSRARIMQGDAAKLLLVFQNFQLNMWYRIFRDIHQSFKGASPQARREARYQLAGMMGMMTLLGGVTGFFGFNVLMAIAGLFFDDKDDPFTFEEEMRRHVIEMFGTDIGGMILNGVPGQLLGIDLTSRIGMPDFFVRAPDEANLDGRDWWAQLIVGLMGVVPSTVINMADGVSLIQQGKTIRGLEMLMPKAIKDVMQAYRFANEGLTTRNGDEILPADQFAAWNLITKAIGFTPAEVAESYDRNSSLMNAESRIMAARSGLLNKFAMALAQGDEETQKAVLERIRAFNAVPAHRAVAITRETIKRSLAARQRNARKREDGVLIQNEDLGRALRDLLPERING